MTAWEDYINEANEEEDKERPVFTSGSFRSGITLSGNLVQTSGAVQANQVKLDGVTLTTVQTGSESFADNDTSIMTSAAIQDKIEAYGYSTTTGDITGVTAGTALSGGGASGAVTLNVSGVTLSELDGAAVITSSESFADNDTTVMTSAAIQDKIEAYGYTTATGDITGVTAGTGLSGGGSSGAVTLNVSGLTVSEFAGASIQTGSESFADNDTTLMTSAAIQDKILSYSYITGVTNIAGNAATATALETARNIGGVSFNGTGDINLPGVNTGGNQATSGNAATATALATARAINDVNFDGTGDITVTADANTLSGTTLKSTVVNSSLTSVGTLTALTCSGAVHFSGTTDAAAGSDSFTFKIGDTADDHLIFDGNEIMAKNTATAADIIYIQADGGSVRMGSNTKLDDVTLVADNVVVGNDTDRSLSSSVDMDLKFDFSGYTGGIGGGGTGHGMFITHNSASRAIIFAPNETERVRISGGSGYLYVGTTGGDDFPGTDGFLSVTGGNRVAAAFYRQSTSSGHNLIYGLSNYSATGTKHFQVDNDGDVDNTNNSYSGFSDERLKENIVDARDYYEDLRKLEVKNFNFCKAVRIEYDYDEDGEMIEGSKRVSLVDTSLDSRKKLLGLVAQPTEQVMSGLIKTDEEGYKHVRYSVLVPMLLQMCQKLADKVEALEG